MLEIPFEIYRGIQDTNKAQQALVSEMTNLVGHDIQIRFNEMDGTRYYLMHDGTGRSSDHKTLSWSLKGQSICVAEKCMDVSANPLINQSTRSDTLIEKHNLCGGRRSAAVCRVGSAPPALCPPSDPPESASFVGSIG
jgi:hypothetical protein